MVNFSRRGRHLHNFREYDFSWWHVINKNNTKNWIVFQAIAQIFEVHPLFSSFKRRYMNVHNEENQMAADNILVVAEQM